MFLYDPPVTFLISFGLYIYFTGLLLFELFSLPFLLRDKLLKFFLKISIDYYDPVDDYPDGAWERQTYLETTGSYAPFDELELDLFSTFISSSFS